MRFQKTVFASSVALAMTALSGSVAADTTSQDITDARQESQIWTTYALSPYLKAADLKVSVHSGKATLTGNVVDGVDKDLAKQIALGVDGIKDVDNQIAVNADYVAPPRAASERTYGEAIEDASITTAVKSKLVWSRYTDGLATDVDTRNGKVTLTGSADTGAAKSLAGQLAMNTRGVSSVDNQLVIKPTAAQGSKAHAAEFAKTETTQVSDTWITTKVKSTFMYSRNVDGSNIGVTTQGGVVTLTGKVDSGAERALAIELAKNVRGVKGVHAKGLAV